MIGLMLLLSCACLLRAQESIQSIGARAQQLETEGRWNEAAEAYRQILAIDPKSIAALNRLGALYVRQNQFAEGSVVCLPRRPRLHKDEGLTIGFITQNLERLAAVGAEHPRAPFLLEPEEDLLLTWRGVEAG